MKQTATTAVFLLLAILMFWKVVLPTLRVTLPVMKTYLPTSWYWCFTAAILGLEFSAWWVLAESYLLIMHSFLA